MSSRAFSPEEIRELRQLAARWGKIVAKRAFGEDGPGLDVDLSTMEQIAHAAAEGLTEGTLQILLGQQAQRLGDEQPCPDCGRPCLVEREPRTLHVKGTDIRQEEPVCHCPDCRRDFFPPKAPSAS